MQNDVSSGFALQPFRFFYECVGFPSAAHWAVTSVFLLVVVLCAAFFLLLRTLRRRTKELEIERSRRRALEIDFQANQSRLELALGSAHMGAWQFDVNTGTTQMSEGAARIIGLDVLEGNIGELLARLVHPDDSEEVDRLWRRAVETGEPYTHEYRIIHSSGGVRWLLSRGKVHDANADGKRMFSGIVADITDKKRSEEALRVSEERFRQTVKATNNAIWDWDLTTNLVAWNDAVGDAFGIARENVGPDAQWWLDRIHPDDRLRIERGIHESIDGDSDHWSDRYRFRRDDGDYARVLDRGFIARNSKGIAQRMVGAMQDLTALSELTERLEENQRRFARVLESVGVGLWYCDLPFDELLWDDRVKSHFWFPPEARITIEDFYARIHPEDRDKTRIAIERSNKERSTYDIVYRTCQPDGFGVKWIRAIGSTSYDDLGSPVHFDGLTLDVTAEKESMEALAEKQRHFSLALTAGRLGSWEIDMQADRAIVSESLGRILGLGPDELEASAAAFSTFTHEDDREPTRLAFESALARGEEGVHLEYRVVSRQGGIRWLSSHMLVHRGEGARVLRVVGVSMDITERKESELALAMSEERFRSLASVVPQIVWTSTPSGRSDYFNERWFAYTGLPRDGSERSREVIHPDDVARVLSESRAAMSEHRTWASEYRLRRHDGEYRWHLGRQVPVKSAGGDLVRWVGTATDIDDQKRFSEVLEQRVEERTAALRASNKELEAFSYSVSHDLRAPLRGIDGFSRMLETRVSGHLPEEGKEFIRRIRAAASRMGTLIDDLLKLSRLSRREMRRDTTDLSAMVREIASELLARGEDRDVNIDIEPGVVALADSSLLRVALENLLGNAWKFTGLKSPASIRFSAGSIGGEVVYTISDNGAGFDMTYSKRLFSAFARLHGAEEFEGTGIGLATVQRVINRHGGRVWAEGTIGVGAAFSFTLTPPPSAGPSPEYGAHNDQ